MVENHNRYREEEKELENEEVVEENDTSTKNEEEKETKKSKKNKKHQDVEEEVLDNNYLELQNEIEKLKEELKKLLEENNNLSDNLLRNRAELENFKKRTYEERIQERKYALKDFLLELINVIDIFEKAVNVKTDDEKVQKFLTGFVMINNMFKTVLQKEGVVKIEALNKPFDPAFHDAIEEVEVENVESGIIVEELQTGYMYKDRVLRPSMVKVNK